MLPWVPRQRQESGDGEESRACRAERWRDLGSDPTTARKLKESDPIKAIADCDTLLAC